jgi:hypothetical protein
MRSGGELGRALLAGLITGLFGVAAFGVVHALTIVPIWRRLAGGIPFGVAAGVAMGWALYEVYLRRRRSLRIWQGLAFGLLLWLTLVPMTALGVLLRLSGLHTTTGNGEAVVESALAFVTGALVGWISTRRLRPALALGTASLGLALATAGPIAVLNSSRAAHLFLALTIVLPLSGAVLFSAFSLLPRRSVAG